MCRKLYRRDRARTSSREESCKFFPISVLNLRFKIADIQMLDWYKIGESKLVDSFAPDVIIAADIVYDNTLFEPLSRTIETFFNKSKNCKLYMACTIRNEDTINEFLSILGGTIIIVLFPL